MQQTADPVESSDAGDLAGAIEPEGARAMSAGTEPDEHVDRSEPAANGSARVQER
jgi:hypothetical protein